MLPVVSVGIAWEHLSNQISNEMQGASVFPSLCCWQHCASATTQWDTARTSSIWSITQGQRESSHSAHNHTSTSTVQQRKGRLKHHCAKHPSTVTKHSFTSPLQSASSPPPGPAKYPSCFLFPSWQLPVYSPSQAANSPERKPCSAPNSQKPQGQLYLQLPDPALRGHKNTPLGSTLRLGWTRCDVMAISLIWLPSIQKEKDTWMATTHGFQLPHLLASFSGSCSKRHSK